MAAKGQQVGDGDTYEGINGNGDIFGFQRTKEKARGLETYNRHKTETNLQEAGGLMKLPVRIAFAYMKHTERMPAKRMTRAQEMHSKSASFEKSTECDMNWGKFINALPTLLHYEVTTEGLRTYLKSPPPQCPPVKESKAVSSGINPGIEHQNTHPADNEIHIRPYCINVYPHLPDKATTPSSSSSSSSSAATSTTTTTNLTTMITTDYQKNNSFGEYSTLQYLYNFNSPTFSNLEKFYSPETEDEQYEYVMSYDELYQAVKNVKEPGGSAKDKLKMPLRNFFLAVFNTGQEKHHDTSTKLVAITGRTTGRNIELPFRFHDIPQWKHHSEKSTLSSYLTVTPAHNNSYSPPSTTRSSTSEIKSSTNRLLSKFRSTITMKNTAQTQYRNGLTTSARSITKLKYRQRTQNIKYFPPEYKTKKLVPTVCCMFPHMLLAPRP